MIRYDVIVVGGGPAGSTAAKALGDAGMDVLILDKEEFPRMKPCAGWITPRVVRDLHLDGTVYSGALSENRQFRVHVTGFGMSVRSPQYSIRRVEFDAFLLKRSGAEVAHHKVEEIRQEGSFYMIDGLYTCRYLIGAGGTSCPVNRLLFEEKFPRNRRYQAAALEEEFDGAPEDQTTRLRFFDEALPGYTWIVPKKAGYLNVGIGAMSERLRSEGMNLRDQWQRFIGKATDEGLVPQRNWKPLGHTYYLVDRQRQARIDNALLVGDSLGVATLDLAEGIGPSVRSSLRAARSILTGERYNPFTEQFSIDFPLAGRLIARRMVG